MKVCSNCDQVINENFKVKIDNAPFANIVLFKPGELHKLSAYVCPHCGKVEFYITQNSEGKR